jgi:excisionase family DNA binding protein
MTATYTPAQLAERFQVGERTIRRWAQQGLIPSIKVGRTVRFPVEAVEAMERAPAAAPEAV